MCMWGNHISVHFLKLISSSVAKEFVQFLSLETILAKPFWFMKWSEKKNLEQKSQSSAKWVVCVW